MKEIIAYKGQGKSTVPKYLSALCNVGRKLDAGTRCLHVRRGGIVNEDIPAEDKLILKYHCLPIMHQEFPQLKKPFSGTIICLVTDHSRYIGNIDMVKIIEN